MDAPSRPGFRTNQFGACAKREVSRDAQMARVMGGRSPRLGPWRVVALALLVGGLVLAAVPLSHAAGPTRGGNARLSTSVTGGGAYSWTNGLVRLSFPTVSPAYSLESVANPSVRVNQSLTGLAEVSPDGEIVAMASFTSTQTQWTLVNSTGSSGTTVTLSASVPVVPSSGEWESGDGGNETAAPVGNVAARITFQCANASGAAPQTVAYSLNLTTWPWLSQYDSLGMEVRSNLTTQFGFWQLAGTNGLDGISRASGAAAVSFTWGASALTAYKGNRTEDSQVDAYHNLTGNDSSSLVRLNFTAVPGNYSRLSYDPWLEILSPGKVGPTLAAIVLTPFSLVALLTGAAVVGALAVVARRRRTPPEAGL